MKLVKILIGLALIFMSACILEPLNEVSTVFGRTLKIMPLGDSITEGFPELKGGYRLTLSESLNNRTQSRLKGGTQFDFVGTLRDTLLPGEQPGRFLLQHEGHRGWHIKQISEEVVQWIEVSNPDLILLMIGTNDIIHTKSPKDAVNALESLLGQIVRQNSKMRISVATLTPLTDPEFEKRAQVYNQAIPGVVLNFKKLGYFVDWVDMHSALTVEDLIDQIHPTDQGYEKMAKVWDKVIQNHIMAGF